MGIRYSKIENKNKREIVLLKGLPCKYGKCKFCNYIEDNSTNLEEIDRVNKVTLEEVTGEFGALEIINSGSVFELPESTLERIREVVKKKKIKLIYFEIYYGYKNRLDEIKDFFKGVDIRFRMGMETFDDEFRINSYGKNFKLTKIDLEDLSDKLYSICLLICVKGQTKEMIQNDIELGLKYFKSITINIFINNGTEVERDEELVKWFVDKYAYLQEDLRVELLIDNKDLGVFEQ
ncbi:MAG: radical SAM protein [Cetobacterium sp.]|uniref:radical SAM protein n=1 Tax=Cetobacterium sp. TaxID=2071632 RepID=UPI003F3D420B